MKRISIYIEGSAVTNGLDVVQVLQQVPQSTIRDMQKSIEEIGWSLQYSIPPSTAGLGSRWNPPFKDSVDVMMEKLFLHASEFKT